MSLARKDGAILSNAGHFDVEVNVAKLKEMAVETGVARNNIQYYKLANGNRINVIAEGRLVKARKHWTRSRLILRSG